jgi:uncharacterized protein HemX
VSSPCSYCSSQPPVQESYADALRRSQSLCDQLASTLGTLENHQCDSKVYETLYRLKDEEMRRLREERDKMERDQKEALKQAAGMISERNKTVDRLQAENESLKSRLKDWGLAGHL